MALFVPAILINMISFGFKVMSLNVYEVRGLYAFNQYIYAIIVAYLVFWIIWKTKAIPVDTPSPDLPGQLENVQQSGNEIAERGMPI